VQYEARRVVLTLFTLHSSLVTRHSSLFTRHSSLHPSSIISDDADEFVDGAGGGDVAFDDFLTTVESDAVWAGPYVAVVGVGHFAGPIHDAAHDANLDSLEVIRVRADHGCGLLEVEECAST
jgi:hypothetical protein